MNERKRTLIKPDVMTIIGELKWYLVVTWFSVIAVGCGESDNTLFTPVSSNHSNISFENTLKETEEFNVLKYLYFYNGGGVAIGDVNNDGKPDIYFTGNMVASHLYINQGVFEFNNVAKEAGVEAAGLWNTGVSMADVNRDGWLDIYICRSAAASDEARRNRLFINDGVDENGEVHFTESAAAYGLDDASYSTQSAFFDYDRDGDLDMFLLNHSIPKYASFTADIEQLKKLRNPLFSSKLYENKGGRFENVSKEAGLINNVLSFGLGVAISDLNGDGWPDIYVSNDFNEEDYLYINQQDGTFRDELRSRMDYTSLFSMGSDAGDVNNDGRMDMLTLDMLPESNYRIKLTSGADNFNKYQLLLDRNFYRQNMRNMLQVNQGNGQFKEVGQMAGIAKSDWSWSALLGDYNLDGWSDLFVTNGYARDYTNMDFMTYAMNFKMENPEMRDKDIPLDKMIELMPQISVPNKMYKNTEEGKFFKDVSAEWGFSEPGMSNGAAYGDLDGDGDLDLVVNNVNNLASVFKNNTRERLSNHFLAVKPLSSTGSQPAIGATVTLYTDSIKMVRELYTSRGYQSSVQPILLFGLGDRSHVDSLVVEWPTGESEMFLVDSVDRYVDIIRGKGKERDIVETPATIKRPIFYPDSTVSYIHTEDQFVDFDVQSLLPRFYSRIGPPMAQSDLNGDGLTDILIGGGPGQPAVIWMGSNDGWLERGSSLSVFQDDAGYEDVAVAIADLDRDEDQDILIASGGNQFPTGDPQYALRYYENTGGGRFVRNEAFPEVLRNASCLVTGDFNRDGLTDVFLGSAYKAQQYPYPAGNVIIWNQGNGGWEVDEEMPFNQFICMDGEWNDLDGDGQSELILGGEWEKVEIWSYADDSWKLSGQSNGKGLVTVLKTENLDDDPEREIIVGNWGENSELTAAPDQPLVLYYGDFDGNGSVDPVLSYYVEGKSWPFVSRGDLTGQLSFLKKKFLSYHAYGETTMEELLQLLPGYKSDSAQILSSYILDRVNGEWVSTPLPVAAQVAPVFAIETLDFDQDGDQDIVLAGNSRYNRVKIGEMEANHGVLLRNTGGLNFSVVSPMKSGLNLSGEVRSILTYPMDDAAFVLFGVNDGKMQVYRYQQLEIRSPREFKNFEND